MKKRGQITIFVVIALIIISLVAVAFLFKDKIIGIVQPSSNQITNFVENCIEDVGQKVISKIGAGGGYYFPPILSTDSGIPYYYNSGNYMPTKQQIEDEISYYISKSLFFCTRNFADFPDFDIKQGEINSRVLIKPKEISLEIEYPLTISKGENTIFIRNFKKNFPVRLGTIYDSVYKSIQEQPNHEGICFSCLSDISLKNDLFVNMFDYDNKTVIFVFKDYNSQINGEAFEFIFANKYK